MKRANPPRCVVSKGKDEEGRPPCFVLGEREKREIIRDPTHRARSWEITYGPPGDEIGVNKGGGGSW
jgi:hypothetical protein